MERTIQEKLKEIETKEKVKIILAVESGSRAWGFESKDSDYDVRFLYVREKSSYLKLEQVRDVIEWQLDEVFDINGWDIQKMFRLLYKSNPTIFEWFSSPIVYKNTPEAERIKAHVEKYFSAKKSLFHYWNMANSNDRNYLKTDTVRAKKYLYVLRPILASKWILRFDELPPIAFDKLASEVLDETLKPVVADLVKSKKETNELDSMKRLDVLNDYIKRELVELKAQAKRIPQKKNNQWEPLNELFLSIVD